MNTSQGGKAHLYVLTSHDREVGTGHGGEARTQNPGKMRRKVRVSELQPRSFTGRKQEDPTRSVEKRLPRPQASPNTAQVTASSATRASNPLCRAEGLFSPVRNKSLF